MLNTLKSIVITIFFIFGGFLYKYFTGFTIYCGLTEFFDMGIIAKTLTGMLLVFWVSVDPVGIVIPAIWGAYIAWDWNILMSIGIFALAPLLCVGIVGLLLGKD
ncbi:hypothetical protein IJZ97_05780 [bacterium]|nr:hypothetical protein [bacterium]